MKILLSILIYTTSVVTLVSLFNFISWVTTVPGILKNGFDLPFSGKLLWRIIINLQFIGGILGWASLLVIVLNRNKGLNEISKLWLGGLIAGFLSAMTLMGTFHPLNFSPIVLAFLLHLRVIKNKPTKALNSTQQEMPRPSEKSLATYLLLAAQKTLKICLIVLAVIIVATIVFFQNWSRNPWGLEEERLGPKGNKRLPPITRVRNATNNLLFSYPEKNTFAIHLAVPNHYIHSSHTTSRLVKSHGASVYMYYPELNGKFHPSNTNLPKCNGYCNGYVRAYIDVKENYAQVRNTRELEQLREDRLSNNPLYQFEDLDSEFGLDDHFQKRYLVHEKKSNGNKNSTDEYLLKRDINGEVQYLFECSPYAPSPSCGVRFNLSSRPELLVDIRFGRHLMGDWEDIIQSVDKKITSFKPVRVDEVSDP